MTSTDRLIELIRGATTFEALSSYALAVEDSRRPLRAKSELDIELDTARKRLAKIAGTP